MRLRPLPLFALGLLLCLAISLAYTEIVIRDAEGKSAFVSAELQAKAPEFFADQEILSKEEFFHESLGKNDAGDWLNERLAWHGDTAARLGLPTGASPELGVPTGFEKKEISADWPARVRELNWEAVDLRWMKNLGAFDHWDYFRRGPLANKKSELARLNLFALPLPDVSPLTRAAHLRLLQGLRERNPIPALKEVKQLARLFYTTETLVGSLVAVSLLEAEYAAYEQAVKAGMIKATAYSPMPELTRARAKRAVWAAGGFSNFQLPDDLLAKIFLGPTLPAGSCAGLSEGIIQTLLVRSMLQHHFPLERDFRPKLARFGLVIDRAKERCRFSGIMPTWEDDSRALRALYPDHPRASNFSELVIQRGRSVPYLRQAIALQLRAIALPNMLHLYDQPLPARETASEKPKP